MMRNKIQFVYLGVLQVAALALLIGCHSVGDHAPVEVKQAEKAVKAAREANMEDYMPSAMEAANRKLDQSVSFLEESTDYTKKGISTQAQGAQAEAIRVANEAKLIAETGNKLIKDMKAFDTNSAQYITSNERTAQSDAYQAQMSTLENKLSDANTENQKLANQPTEQSIPADFRIGKPVAYFTTGSTIVSAKYRDEIEELATLIKKNEELQVKLEGFADPRGSASLNKKLADQRLAAVAEVLKQNGVEAERIKLVSVGATADSSTVTGQQSGALQLDRKVTATMMTGNSTNQ